jgi:hypothetical protein
VRPELEPDLLCGPKIIAICPVFSDQSVNDLEEVSVLDGIRPAGRLDAYKNSPVHGNARLGVVHSGACRADGHPIALGNHLVDGVRLAQRIQTLVKSRQARLVDPLAVVV